jgi:hypothetical protein
VGSDTERGVSFVANLVTIAGFAAAVLGWIGVEVLPRYTPPSNGVALLILLLFTVFAGYGTSIILRDRFLDKKPFFFLMILFMIGFAFSFSYIRNYLIGGLDGDQHADFTAKSFLIAWLIYWFMNTMIFCYGIWFKDENIIWVYLTAIFRPSYWAAFATMLIHLAGLPLLLVMFTAGEVAN